MCVCVCVCVCVCGSEACAGNGRAVANNLLKAQIRCFQLWLRRWDLEEGSSCRL